MKMRRLMLTLVVAVLCGCGASAPSASSSPTSPVALSCTASGPASSAWPRPESASVASPAILSAAASGNTLKLTFLSGAPEFQIEPTSTAHFAQDPSGSTVDLAGSSGAQIVLRGFRGDMSNYAGQKSMSSSGPLLLQVNQIGDFEGVVTFAAGLSKPACANVVASGQTLTFHFIAAP
jgi:hypothetical protein